MGLRIGDLIRLRLVPVNRMPVGVRSDLTLGTILWLYFCGDFVRSRRWREGGRSDREATRQHAKTQSWISLRPRCRQGARRLQRQHTVAHPRRHQVNGAAGDRGAHHRVSLPSSAVARLWHDNARAAARRARTRAGADGVECLFDGGLLDAAAGCDASSKARSRFRSVWGQQVLRHRSARAASNTPRRVRLATVLRGAARRVTVPILAGSAGARRERRSSRSTLPHDQR